MSLLSRVAQDFTCSDVHIIRIDEGRFLMLHHAVIFFIVALVTAILGFSGIAGGAAGLARIVFFVFSMGAIVSVFFSVTRRA
jgi:uncharacterized membrane protein YtjA (UPF0391 family)